MEEKAPLQTVFNKCYEDLLLLNQKENVNQTILETGKLLYIASKIVKLLLEKGESIEERLTSKYSLLHWAVLVKEVEIIELLIQHGANVNVKNIECGYTPLHLAVINCQSQGSENFRNKFNLREIFSNNIEKINEYRCLPLHRIFENNLPNEKDQSVISFLISSGADINARNWDEETVLHCAARHQDMILMRYLMERGALCNVSSDGHHPLDLLIGNEYLHTATKYMVLYDCEDPYEVIHPSDKYNTKYTEKCRKELNELRQITIAETDITWGSFMITDDKYLEKILRNIHVKEELKDNSYLNKFPHYGSIIEGQIAKGVKRIYLCQLIIVFLWSNLPVDICWFEIFKYLDTSDLENFLYAIAAKNF